MCQGEVLMNRFFIQLQFAGTHFSGWQVQPNAPSVQEKITSSLETLLKHKVELVGAGRTDTGVHATVFYAHFDTSLSQEEIDKKQLVISLNALTGNDIFIQKIFQVELDIHARFSALSRTYRYYICLRKDPFRSQFSYHIHYLPDINLMNEACSYLFKYNDFTSFSKLHTQTATNNCKIMLAQWEQKGHVMVFTIKADRFLRNMVRAITGTMLEIGKGKISPEAICDIIESKDRGKAGTSVPAHGLFLEDIAYPGF